MQKKIYVPVVAVIVAVSAVLAGATYNNYIYDPFDDPAYAHNMMSHSEQEDNLESYSGNKTITKSHAVYPMYTIQQIIDIADIIAIGTIADIEYVEVPRQVGNLTAYSVYTRFTMAVEEQFKGPSTQELLFVSSGGETEKVVSPRDGFKLDRGDHVLFFLAEYNRTDSTIVYTPVTPSGEYKILNNTQVAKHNESVMVPLEDFVDLIRKTLDG